MAQRTPSSTTKKTARAATPARSATKTAATKAGRRKTAAAKKTTAKRTTAKKTTAKKASTTKTAAPRSAVAAAAERAGGERARRRSTPLLAGSETTAPPTKKTTASSASRPTPSHRASRPAAAVGGSAPTSGTTKGASRPARTTRSTTRATGAPALRVVDGEGTGTRRPRRATTPRPRVATAPTTPSPASAPAEGTPSSGTALAPGVAELLSVALSAGQVASRTIGGAVSNAAGEEWERRLGEVLSFLRRRVQGDYSVDDFGFDEDFTLHTAFPVLRLLKDRWFRVEVRGIENIPATGGALVVSNHSGTIALDSVMTQLAIHDAHPQHRFLRMLGADLVFALPVVGDFARKTGATLATNPDAERLMTSGELVGVWPEGFKGVGKPFRERYKLQRFGRGGFVAAAIRSEVPIIPCSVVGAEEIYPMVGNAKTLARLLGAPYAPITPTFPLLGPLGLVPLPSKWIIEFSPPVDTASLGPAAADDPALVFDLTDQVRETIQQTLYSVLMTRRSVFF
ncbi:lysophospholipid acyltransferase family protein [Janibacter melonis]|uniref:lysophospholipid acyltransferase family protein n=1 Tax=Janibacter melonis TaxID=262209 RepID=UPI0020964C55|nr:1-acyl-sn-glycerol-3-phosphate acyltransferase [Janibacter melonis]